MLHWLRQHIPFRLLLPYHWVLAQFAALVYGFPSRKLIVVAVTGTKGKSSTVQFTAQLLERLGQKVGYSGTAGFSIAGKKIENRLKMTMPGRFYLQKLLRSMVHEGCRYALVETTSQGLVQYRHVGINVDVAVFTNLSPEHIEAHGGFEAYKQAKAILFKHLHRRPTKTFDGVIVPKTIIVNADDSAAAYYASFGAARTVHFGWEDEGTRDMVPRDVMRDETGMHMTIDGVPFFIPLIAPFEQTNALCAIAIVRALGFPLQGVANAAGALRSIAGRFERVDAGQPFHVIVDYAYEPRSLQVLLEAVEQLKPNRVIGVHGSAGGGRDVARREKIGRFAGEHEDIVIVTNEDPYDDDPRSIIDAVAAGARAVGKKDNVDLFTIDDRSEAIEQAIQLAQPGDVVMITGKGSEPVMAVAGGKKIPWDDRAEARHALAGLGYEV